MKRLKFSEIFLALLLLLNSTLGINLLFQNSLSNTNLSNYVCKITKDIMEPNGDTQDVLIGDMGTQNQKSLINGIAGCVKDDSAVVVTDLKTLLVEKDLRKATAVILVFESVDVKTIQSIIRKHHFGSIWHHMAKVICLVPSTLPMKQRLDVLAVFKIYGFLDVSIFHETDTGNIKFETFESLSTTIRLGTNQANASLIFPDKLEDMKGYELKIVAYLQSPLVKIVKNRISAPFRHFLDAVATARNARVKIIFLRDYSLMKQLWVNREMHLTLNTAMTMISTEPKLLTYEEDGFCVLVPLPPKMTVSELMFVKPFDGLTWFLLLLTMVSFVAVWWMFRGRGAVDSPWLLAYGMVVMFIGQGVDFSRKNRRVLVILLQMIIFMIFVLSSAYEGIITSFMIDPVHENRLKTFDDVLASKYGMIVDQTFASMYNNTEEFKAHRSRIIVRDHNANDTLSERAAEHRFALIVTCNLAEYLIQTPLQDGLLLSDYYYLLPQKVSTKFMKLEASYANPFLRMLQHYMDLCVQAGLPQAWKIFERLYRIDRSQEPYSDEPANLKLKDLVQVFCILIIGYAVSFLVLLIEIFFHDFLRNLKLAYLARKLRNRVHQMAYKKRPPKDVKYRRGALYYIIHRHQKSKRLKPKRLKVREIFVRPRNLEE